MEKLCYPNEPSGPELRMKSILDSLGLKYEYQFSVRAGFVLDFAFPDKMVGIEVDGYYHQFSKRKDAFRGYILKRAGWKVLRIEADSLNHEEQIENLVAMALS